MRTDLEWPREREARREMKSARAMADPHGAEMSPQTGNRPRIAREIIAAIEAGREPAAIVGTLASGQFAEAFGRARARRVSRAYDAAQDASAVAVILHAGLDAVAQDGGVAAWRVLLVLLRELNADSWELEDLVAARAREDPRLRAALLHLALEVVRGAAADPGHRITERERSGFRSALRDWRGNPNLLDLWFGVRSAGYLTYRGDDLGLLRIVLAIDSRAYMDLLARFDQPFSVLVSLQRSGAERDFTLWRDLLALAPSTADGDASWSGSTVAPLLLTMGLDALCGVIHGPAPEADRDALARDEDGVRRLARAMAGTLAARTDAAPLGARWAAWLARSCMSKVADAATPFPVHARMRGFAERVLLESLAEVLPPAAWREVPTPDLAEWEVWCHRAARGFAHDNRTQLPAPEAFIAEWDLSPEDWHGSRGATLRERAALFTIFGGRPDAFGTRLLAVAFAFAPDPARAWEDLWRATGVLREVAEFAALDGARHDAPGAPQAGELLRLAFGLGLATLDFLVDPGATLDLADRGRALRELFGALDAAAAETILIDRFGAEFWRDAQRHLAARRALWQDGPATTSLAATFDARAEPSLAALLRRIGNDPGELLTTLDVLDRNGVGRGALGAAITEARLDLAASLATAEHLNDLDPRRPAAPPSSIALARSLLAQGA